MVAPGADDIIDTADLSAEIAQRTAAGHQLVWIRPADDPAAAMMTSASGRHTLLRRTPLHIARGNDAQAWHVGRAQMGYRDLIPDRWYGRFIASHIRVPTAGEVPDSVHHHDVRFQFLAVRQGAVQVVYEDQGDPFWMSAGDVVLQPPHIRHRVLATDGDFEIVEIGAPADHLTEMDHQMTLPNGTGHPQRRWSGQRFVVDRPGDRATVGWDCAGVAAEPTAIADATDGLVHVERLTADDTAIAVTRTPLEFRFMFVMEGTAIVHIATSDEPLHLNTTDAVTLPPAAAITDMKIGDGWILDVRVPAAYDE
ncbi:MAG: cupin [Ilumatobacteraceae bacterium]